MGVASLTLHLCQKVLMHIVHCGLLQCMRVRREASVGLKHFHAMPNLTPDAHN